MKKCIACANKGALNHVLGDGIGSTKAGNGCHVDCGSGAHVANGFADFRTIVRLNRLEFSRTGKASKRCTRWVSLLGGNRECTKPISCQVINHEKVGIEVEALVAMSACISMVARDLVTKS